MIILDTSELRIKAARATRNVAMLILMRWTNNVALLLLLRTPLRSAVCAFVKIREQTTVFLEQRSVYEGKELVKSKTYELIAFTARKYCILNGLSIARRMLSRTDEYMKLLNSCMLLNWDNTVHIVIRLRAVRGARHLCLFESLPTVSGLHPASCLMCIGSSFPGYKATGTWISSFTLLMSRWRICGANMLSWFAQGTAISLLTLEPAYFIPHSD